MKAIAALLDLVPSWAWAMIVGALLLSNGVTGFKLADARLNLADARTEVAEMQVAIADANTQAALQSAALESNVVKAQNESKKREANLRSAAAAAATESDGLRGDLEALRVSLDKLSRDAVIERAAAVGVVLTDCSRRYQGMAAIAERHASDVRTLMDAWPRSPASAAGNLKR